MRGLSLPLEIDADAGTATVHGSHTYGALAPSSTPPGSRCRRWRHSPHLGRGRRCDRDPRLGRPDALSGGRRRRPEIIGPDGEIRTVERGDQDFPGSVVALGALGVVTRVKLAVEPTFQVRQDVVNGIAWDTVLSRFDEITSAAYSVSIFTRWDTDAVDQVWIKSRAEDGPRELFGGTLATGDQHPILGLDPVNATAQMGAPGPWYDRLPHFRMGFTPATAPRSRASTSCRGTARWRRSRRSGASPSTCDRCCR